MDYDYKSGTTEMVRPAEINSHQDMYRYFCQQTGVTPAIGQKQRSHLVHRMTEEMTNQMWTYAHLVASIQYIKNRGIKVHSFDYVYWNVGKAVAAGYLGRNRLTVLDEQVAEAIYYESDPAWIRKLSLAKGVARSMVYDRWVKERGLNAIGV